MISRFRVILQIFLWCSLINIISPSTALSVELTSKDLFFFSGPLADGEIQWKYADSDIFGASLTWKNLTKGAIPYLGNLQIEYLQKLSPPKIINVDTPKYHLKESTYMPGCVPTALGQLMYYFIRYRYKNELENEEFMTNNRIIPHVIGIDNILNDAPIFLEVKDKTILDEWERTKDPRYVYYQSCYNATMRGYRRLSGYLW
jgi:hypothetical protein